MARARDERSAGQVGVFDRLGDARGLVPRERDPISGRLTDRGRDDKRRSRDHDRGRPRFSRGVVVGAAVAVAVVIVGGVAVAVSGGGGGGNSKDAKANNDDTSTTVSTPFDDGGFAASTVADIRLRAPEGLPAISYTVEGQAQPLSPIFDLIGITCTNEGCTLYTSMGQGAGGLKFKGNRVSGRVAGSGCTTSSWYEEVDLQATGFKTVEGVRVPTGVSGTTRVVNDGTCPGGPASEVVYQGSTPVDVDYINMSDGTTQGLDGDFGDAQPGHL